LLTYLTKLTLLEHRVVAGVDRAKQGVNWINKAYHTINLKLDEIQAEVSQRLPLGCKTKKKTAAQS